MDGANEPFLKITLDQLTNTILVYIFTVWHIDHDKINLISKNKLTFPVWTRQLN